MGCVFVHGEARALGGDLEEHAARLFEVDGTEPEPVDHLGGMRAGLLDLAAHRELFLLVGHAEGHVVDSAGAPLPEALPRQLADLPPAARASPVGAEAVPSALLAHGLEPESAA